MIASTEPFEEIVLKALRPHARVLEIGCGKGELAQTLGVAGHRVTAVDPEAPEGDIFVRTRIQDFEAPARSFDAVVAARSLHHLDDLECVLDKAAAWLHSGGVFIAYEFGWDRVDSRTLQWYYRRWKELGMAPRKGAAPPSLQACEERWRDEHTGLHGSQRMLAAFDARFERHRYARTPFLCSKLGDDEGVGLEACAIEAGEIEALGFIYVGGLLDVDG